MTAWLTVLAVLGIAAAACSPAPAVNRSTESPPQSPPSAAAQYLELAAEINARRDAAENDLKVAGGDLTKLHATYAELAQIRRDAIARLATIPFPPQSQPYVQALVTALGEEDRILRRMTVASLEQLTALESELARAGDETTLAASDLRSSLGLPGP